ncbi:MAG: hypothetical protein KIH10_15465 [Candidatus Freyarchaeota archaeon]|nr:hypothetical protein [Candidatus Jordarchaeia archaeon]
MGVRPALGGLIKTAFSTINSRRRNYTKGKRKRRKPVVRRPFARVKQTLMKISGEKLRITIKPHQHVTINLSRRHFKIRGRIGEPILTPTKIHTPLETNPPKEFADAIGWDSNLHSR